MSDDFAAGHFPGDFVVGIVIGALLMWRLYPYIAPTADAAFARLDRWLDRRRSRGRH